jgi:hypothetical protein
MECDAEHDQAMTVQQDYRARLCASTTGLRCSLHFDRVLSGRQFNLSVQEVDLYHWSLAQDLYSSDRRDLSVELERLHKLVPRDENERATEAEQLS